MQKNKTPQKIATASDYIRLTNTRTHTCSTACTATVQCQ